MTLPIPDICPRGLRRGALVWVLLMATPALCAAQEISGFVKDVSGGVVPGVSVSATQIATGLSRTAVSNPAGYGLHTVYFSFVFDAIDITGNQLQPRIRETHPTGVC